MMPDPLGRLEAEHAEALVVLRALESAADALFLGDDIPAQLAAVRRAHAFLSTTVRRHNESEEAALFPLLGQDAPTDVFIGEHRELRHLEQVLLEALGGPNPRGAVPPVAYALADLLRTHIQRENGMLFPMARSVLGDGGLALVAERLAG